MQLSKNKKYQYLFFFILTIYTIFNGGNSNLSIQINFILVSLLFLFCLKDKNYNLHLKNFYKDNQKSIFIYLIFIFYLLFQIVPLPVEMLKIFSPEKFKILSKLEGEKNILKNFPSATILRPSVVYSVDDNFTTNFMTLLCRLPIFPIYYKGETKFAPIHCSDLTDIIYNVIFANIILVYQKLK